MLQRKLSRYVVLLACGWTALLGASAVWNVLRTSSATHELALSETRTHVDQERAFNLWLAGLGTVYAPVTEDRPSNPLLAFRPDRDLTDSWGRALTLVSPHILLPHTESTQPGGGSMRQRLASLKPVDPNRDPDAWERAALLAFQEGQQEFSALATQQDRQYLRLMKPLIAERSCLDCHGRQGYHVGDIRGGLEAWTDLGAYHAAARGEMLAIGVTHGLFWLLGLLGICVGGRRLTRSLAERDRAEAERHRMEVQVQQAQKLESLGVLAGGIAHDFNNLLTGILGHVSLALEQLPPATVPPRTYLEKAQRAALRGADLTKHMLAYAGQGPLRAESVELNRVVTELADLLDVSRSKKATLAYQLADDLPPIAADAAQLGQVIMNLITNASEALGERSGAITVSTGMRECDREYLRSPWLEETPPSGRYVYLEVRDTGCGMDAATLARIFDPFFSTKFVGRGLGLAAVLGIVRRHHGAIQVHSEAGVGTTIRVLLPPAERIAASADAPQFPAGAGPRTGTILVVDDEPEVLEVASISLDQLGFQVLTAPDGRAALDVFRTHAREIDAVLLDLTMPHLSGAEVFREMRRVRPGVPVVLTSGYSEREVAERLADADYSGFLQKPYLASTLATRLRQAMRR